MAHAPGPTDTPRRAPPAPGTYVLVGALAAVVLPVALSVALPPSGTAPPDFVPFLGRFHTLAVHLPIGVLVLVAAAEALTLSPRLRERIDPGLGLALPFLVATSVTAFTLGILLARGGGYPARLVMLHRGFTLAAVVGSAACMVAWSRRQRDDGTVRRTPYRATLGATLGLITLGAHFGGSMTHGDTYLTRYAPSFVQRLVNGGRAAPPPSPEIVPVAPAAEPLVWDSIVLPLLRERCVECHGPDKAKGGLRVDSLAAILKGGDTGAAIKPGLGAGSPLVARMRLPPSDDEHMPPEGKAGLAAGEIEVIRWWIDRGATEALRVRDGIASDGARAVLQKAAEETGAKAAGAASTSSPSPHPPPEAPASSSTASTIAPPATPVAKGAARLVFRDVVEPVLAAGCGRCHGSAEHKGKLRVDSLAALVAGGKNGAAVVPGNPAAGTLLARMHLAPDDHKHMPPPDEPQLTASQVGAIEWWVAQGAKETTEVGAMPAKLSGVGAAVSGPVKPPAPPSTPAPPAVAAAEGASETPAPAPIVNSRVVGTVALYRDVVAPILTKRCGECHNKDRDEGGVRVDDLAKLVQGGDIVPGKPDDSPILQRMRTLPSASGHMPPRTKPQPGAAEVRAVALFISRGATADVRADASDLPEDVVSALPAGAVTAPAEPHHAEPPAGAVVHPGASGCGACAIGAGETGPAGATAWMLALGLVYAGRRRRARRVG